MSDTCNATERVKGNLKICDLPMNHPSKKHSAGDHEWDVESTSYAGETTTEVKGK
jgi:hypothetical protein